MLLIEAVSLTKSESSPNQPFNREFSSTACEARVNLKQGFQNCANVTIQDLPFLYTVYLQRKELEPHF